MGNKYEAESQPMRWWLVIGIVAMIILPGMLVSKLTERWQWNNYVAPRGEQPVREESNEERVVLDAAVDATPTRRGSVSRSVSDCVEKRIGAMVSAHNHHQDRAERAARRTLGQGVDTKASPHR